MLATGVGSSVLLANYRVGKGRFFMRSGEQRQRRQLSDMATVLHGLPQLTEVRGRQLEFFTS
jgi:hypothetical protein